MPDKYNFYRPSNQKTLGMESNTNLNKSRSRVGSSSDLNLNALESRKGTIILEEKEQVAQTIELPNISTHRSREKSRDRSLERIRPIGNRARLKTIVVVQKNVDSLK